MPVTTAWSRSYGSSVICSCGFIFSFFSFSTSLANTASAAAVESIQFACTNSEFATTAPEVGYGAPEPSSITVIERNIFIQEVQKNNSKARPNNAN